MSGFFKGPREFDGLRATPKPLLFANGICPRFIRTDGDSDLQNLRILEGASHLVGAHQVEIVDAAPVNSKLHKTTLWWRIVSRCDAVAVDVLPGRPAIGNGVRFHRMNLVAREIHSLVGGGARIIVAECFDNVGGIAHPPEIDVRAILESEFLRGGFAHEAIPLQVKLPAGFVFPDLSSLRRIFLGGR